MITQTFLSIKGRTRIGLQLVFLSLFSVVAYAQDGVVSIDPHFFNLDFNKKIILINKNVEEINSFDTQAKSAISSGNLNYTLTATVSEFEIGVAYEVVDIQNEYYDLYFTQLPIINIATDNMIMDSPRVYAHFSMCESNGELTESGIGAEYRGAWSQLLPKKSLRIEFWNDAVGSSTKNIRLLGMRNDDDWNLQAMYNEPLRIRSKMNFELWRKMDTIYYQEQEPEAINGVRQEYVELFVNEEYRGLYALSERVDRKQFKLKPFEDGEIHGELYKGISWEGSATLTSLSDYDNNSELWAGLEYKYPSEEIDWTNIYEFVDFVINEDDCTFEERYQQKFEIDNAINYYIFLNLLKAGDNTGKNVFVAKYDIDEPYFYIPWDLDGTFGILWNGEQSSYTEGILTNGLYERLILDNEENGFLEKLKHRWNELKNGPLSAESIMTAFNTQFLYLELNGVYERELRTWEDCEFFDYNNIEYTYEWLEDRIAFLDGVFNSPGLQTNIQACNVEGDKGFKVYPNPASAELYLDITNDNSTVERISILNALGQNLYMNTAYQSNGKIDIQNLNDGVYFLAVEFIDGFKQVEKFIINR